MNQVRFYSLLIFFLALKSIGVASDNIHSQVKLHVNVDETNASIQKPLNTDKLLLAEIFTDNMVLQRGTTVPVWGAAAPGTSINVYFNGQKKTAVADRNGKWMVRLDSMPANTDGQTLVISGGKTICLHNILVGDVWLAAGQSNMHMSLLPQGSVTPGVLDYADEIKHANYPLIRHVCVAQGGTLNTNAQLHLAWPWQICASNNVGELSAVAYFFARELGGKLNVPIGVIESAQGSTAIEAWIGRDAFDSVPALKSLAMRELNEFQVGQRRKIATPAMNYNAMIAPLIPYALRGIIWYQGESNTGTKEQAEEYRVLFSTLIRDWRNHWRQPNLPFYYVQLPNYNRGANFWPYLREAQLQVLRETTNTGMAVTIDIGDYFGDAYGDSLPLNHPIHSRNKQDVGLRLARWALARDYNFNIACSGPLFSHCILGTNYMRLFFEHTNGGLMVGRKTGPNPVVEIPNGTLSCFEVAGKNGEFVNANAKIDGNTIIVSSPLLPRPVAARYAWAACPTNCNFYNRAGLPASPFRTDGFCRLPVYGWPTPR
jgi:sialate O-acetylesterase